MLNVTINRNIFEESLEADYSKHPSQFFNIDSIEKVESVMDNLTKMVERSKNTSSEYVWKVKAQEFQRQLRWNALKELAFGNETNPYK